jgi:hypothetical protein
MMFLKGIHVMCLAKLDSLESEHASHGHLDQNLGKFIALFGIITPFRQHQNGVSR